MSQYKLLVYHSVVSISFFLLVIIMGLQREYSLMFMYSLNSFFVFGVLLYRELKYFTGIKIHMLLLLAYLMRMVYPSITQSLDGIKTGKVFLGDNYDISDSVFETAIMMNLYYVIIYFFMIKNYAKINLEKFVLPYLMRYNITLISIILFTIGTLYNILVSFFPNTIVPYMIAIIVGNFSTMAILLQLMNASLLNTKSKTRVFVLFVLVEIFRSMFFGFMKGPIMMAACFYVLYCVLKAKYNNKSILNIRNITTFSISIVFLLYVVYPFITIKREVAQWDIAAGGVVNASYSNMEILNEVLTGRKKNEKSHMRSRAIDRLDALSVNSFFVDYVNKSESYNYEFIKESVHGMTPRFLNKDKHASRAGLMATSLFHSGTTGNYDVETSNSYIGQTASAYMIGGVFMVLLLACINGYVLSKYYTYLTRHLNNLLAFLFFVILLVGSINGFEEIHDGGLNRCVFYCLYMVLISITNKFSFFKLSLKQKRK